MFSAISGFKPQVYTWMARNNYHFYGRTVQPFDSCTNRGYDEPTDMLSKTI